jgi:signal transduction histidine kinase
VLFPLRPSIPLSRDTPENPLKPPAAPYPLSKPLALRFSALPLPARRLFAFVAAASLCLAFTRAVLAADANVTSPSASSASTPAATPVEPLTEAAAILALPSDTAAAHLRVTLNGVVTAAEPDWEGKFFVEDASGGVFVVGTGRQPQVGDRVSIQGATGRGAFAPIVSQATWTITGPAALPAARPTTIERLMAGVEDGQRVEFSGIVRSVRWVPSRKLGVDISFGGHRVHVFPKLPAQINPETLVAAKVRVRGTVAASFNAALRQLTSINVYVPTPEDFVVELPEESPPFEQPILPLGEIARYRPDVNRGGRIHVRGVVTFYRPGLDLYIQDTTGGLHLESVQLNRLAPGDTIEAVGFLTIDGFQPVLEDARIRRLTETPAVFIPPEVPFAELRAGRHGNQLIRLEGRLVGRSVSPVRRDDANFSGVRTLCTIQNADLTFIAECEHALDNQVLANIPLDSLVSVSGVAAVETGDDGQLRTLTLLQRTPDDVRVLATPSWFTPQRLLIGLGVLFILSAAVIGWSLTVSKKNAMLSFLVAEREKAQRELQLAHDQLERRVEERTDQLKIEMTARRASEVEFKATLAERTRLARELHDTLEQALTGIALQLDTTAKLLDRSPADAARHLELARGFMRQSQLELRRSIWDLRSRELEQFDLAAALLHTGHQLTQGGQLGVEIETTGTPQALPEIVEENLLRIGQEALTNIVKHSGATLATIRLEYSPGSVALEIKDNGTGLVAERIASPREQHFGLLGMAERAKRLGGRFSISGAPREGTTVRVTIPLEPVAHQGAPFPPAANGFHGPAGAAPGAPRSLPLS